ncbi:MAG: sulfotransferase [Brumimicrobium sp.]
MNLLKLFSTDFYYQIYLRRIFGKKKKNLDLYDLRQNLDQISPVIFLSTGRCGTKWIDTVLSEDDTIVSLHHPIPVMRSQAKLAYSFEFNKAKENEKELLKELFLAGREDLILQSEKVGKELIITDSRTTFFAEIIYELFPKAKFVHLHRHPGEVVRSGLRRKWYVSNDQSELNRITPIKTSEFTEKWSAFDLIEKNAWLWKETNEWILNFLNKVPESQKFNISFNDWNEESLSELFSFCGARIDKSQINKKLNKKINSQKSVSVSKYKDWNEEDKSKVKEFCSKTAELLGYQL